MDICLHLPDPISNISRSRPFPNKISSILGATCVGHGSSCSNILHSGCQFPFGILCWSLLAKPVSQTKHLSNSNTPEFIISTPFQHWGYRTNSSSPSMYFNSRFEIHESKSNLLLLNFKAIIVLARTRQSISVPLFSRKSDILPSNILSISSLDVGTPSFPIPARDR